MKKITTLLTVLLVTLFTAQASMTGPKDILVSNAYQQLTQAGWQIQHESLSFDSLTLLFSGHEPKKERCFMYLSHFDGRQWSKPQRVLNDNRVEELWPTLAPSQENIFYVRRIFANPNEKNSVDKYQICQTQFIEGVWTKPQPIIISSTNDCSPFLTADGQTMYFARLEGEKKNKQHYRLYYTRRVNEHDWVIPQAITDALEDQDDYGPRLLTDKDSTLRYVSRLTEKKDTTYRNGLLSLAPQYRRLPIYEIKGFIKDATNHRGIAATIVIYDAITAQPLAHLTSQPITGRYRLALPPRGQFRIDITGNRYTHHYINIDTRDLVADKDSVVNIDLSKALQITINLFDNELFSTLETKTYTLPIGENHTIDCSRPGYEPSILTIDTRKAMMLPSTELDWGLTPGKCPIIFTMTNAAKGDTIEGKVTLSHTTLNEQPTNLVRQGGTYAVHATGKKFFPLDTTIAIPLNTDTQFVTLPMQPMLLSMVVRLKNIRFEFNSALITPESYPEIDRLIEMMKENEEVKIELSAHTDNVGNNAYNERLSARRGQAVRSYMVAKGIAAERIKSIGYGSKQPLVPNDSEANRAINRRVEFKIIDL